MSKSLTDSCSDALSLSGENENASPVWGSGGRDDRDYYTPVEITITVLIVLSLTLLLNSVFIPEIALTLQRPGQYR